MVGVTPAMLNNRSMDAEYSATKVGFPNILVVRMALLRPFTSVVTCTMDTPMLFKLMGVKAYTAKTPSPISAACHSPPLNPTPLLMLLAVPTVSTLCANRGVSAALGDSMSKNT